LASGRFRYALTGEVSARRTRSASSGARGGALADLENAGAKVVEQLLAMPRRFGRTKRLAMESSFGGMSVEDDAYARWSDACGKRQTRKPRRSCLVRRKTRGEVGECKAYSCEAA